MNCHVTTLYRNSTNPHTVHYWYVEVHLALIYSFQDAYNYKAPIFS
jgi:hypothetical protein